jgi:ribosomal protein S12 methylthiotransferase accessory factor YcaO
VFKGTWQGRPVAIKQLHADLLDEKNQQKFDEFKQEVYLMKYARVPHCACVVRVSCVSCVVCVVC